MRFNPQPIHIGPMFDKLPPESTECELSLLGCGLKDRNVFPLIRRAVTPQHFNTEKHRAIFQTMCEVFDQTGDTDPVIVADRLKSNGREDSILAMADIDPDVYTSTHKAYSDVLESKFRLRKLIEICGTAIHLAYTAPDDSQATIGSTFEQIAALARNGTEARVVTQREAFDMVLADVEEGKAASIKSGLNEFDWIAGGIPRSGVWTLFGSPGGGKSTLALQIAHNLARGVGTQPPMLVRYYSVEQGPKRAGATQLAQITGVGVHSVLNTGQSSEEEKNEIAFGCLKANPTFAFIDSSMDPNQLYAECASLATKYPHGVLFVDYLQDIPSWGTFVDMTPRITEAMRILARIARELDWLVCVVCQMDKASGKLHQSPKMTDGLGSSAIEQRSDFITYVYRPHQKEVCPPQNAGEKVLAGWKARQSRTRIGIVKSKFGALGATEMQFVPKSMVFQSPDPIMATEHWPNIQEQ